MLRCSTRNSDPQKRASAADLSDTSTALRATDAATNETIKLI
jgi:hypothetical protein